MIDYKVAGVNIKKRRVELGLTQEKVAEIIGITPSFYSHIENGSRHASISTFDNIAKYFEISIDEIINSNNNCKVTNDELETKIIFRLKKLSNKEQNFILNILESLSIFQDKKSNASEG